MASRADLVDRIAELVGEDVLRIESPQNGWPALGNLVVDGVAAPVAIFAGSVGLSHRGRDGVERRFQNPGTNRPIVEIPGRDPLLLGLWEADEFEEVGRPLLVSAEARLRVGRTTRYSVFASMGMLRSALDTGWSEGRSSDGETIRAFAPPLLPLSFRMDKDEAVPPAPAVQAAVEGSGLLSADDQDLPAASERARRAGSTLVRDARFSKRVVDAYRGLCAMCGLDVGLVEGAHIYPVSAPASYDEAWNGLALCANHHLAFDKHLIGVEVESSEIRMHERVLDQIPNSPAVASFVDGTYERLAAPHDRRARPRDEMFRRRYEFYVDSYDWLNAS